MRFVILLHLALLSTSAWAGVTCKFMSAGVDSHAGDAESGYRDEISAEVEYIVEDEDFVARYFQMQIYDDVGAAWVDQDWDYVASTGNITLTGAAGVDTALAHQDTYQLRVLIWDSEEDEYPKATCGMLVSH